MGGVPAMLSGAAGAVGSGLSHGAQALYGAAKSGVQANYIDPVKHGIDTMRGSSPTGPASAPPAAGTPPPQTSSLQQNMENFFNAPQQGETPAQRQRRMMQQEQA